MKIDKDTIKILTRWFGENLERLDFDKGKEYRNGVESEDWQISFRIKAKTNFEKIQRPNEKE
jgi:hypothetical protein